ncbi:hypothetical protein DVH24_006033 [Malus domestica]|uniref:Uncharacterized protein n=1 Tax=Malus domestica TaxID=3750 RepID=A0A498IKR5_MALDO|nr:hypothetical protein DVH24_006033 [Malus domestica]
MDLEDDLFIENVENDVSLVCEIIMWVKKEDNEDWWGLSPQITTTLPLLASSPRPPNKYPNSNSTRETRSLVLNLKTPARFSLYPTESLRSRRSHGFSSAAPTPTSSSALPSTKSPKLETMKTDSSSAAKITKKSKTKKIDRVESSLKESNRDLSLFKFKSDTVIALVVFGLLNSLFEGKAVAKLPFKPFRLVMKISHRGLQGEDATDCSLVFLYFLCSISIWTNLQKLLCFSLPRGTSSRFVPHTGPENQLMGSLLRTPLTAYWRGSNVVEKGILPS